MSHLLTVLEDERVKWSEPSYVPSRSKLNRLNKLSHLYTEVFADVSRATVARRSRAQKKLRALNKIHSAVFILYGCTHANVGELGNVQPSRVENWWHSVEHPNDLLLWAKTFCNEEKIEYFSPDSTSPIESVESGHDALSLTGDVYELTREDIQNIIRSEEITGTVWLTDTYGAHTASFITIRISNELTNRLIIGRPKIM
jgi:hypothetical protein